MKIWELLCDLNEKHIGFRVESKGKLKKETVKNKYGRENRKKLKKNKYGREN